LRGDHEHGFAGAFDFRAAGTRADEITGLAAAFETHQGAEADGIARGKVADGQGGKLGDGQRGLLRGLGLTVRKVGGFEAAGVVFVLGLVLLVGRLRMRGKGGRGDGLQLGGKLGNEAVEEVTFGHGVRSRGKMRMT
jgi:hypothetical protein